MRQHAGIRRDQGPRAGHQRQGLVEPPLLIAQQSEVMLSQAIGRLQGQGLAIEALSLDDTARLVRGQGALQQGAHWRSLGRPAPRLLRPALGASRPLRDPIPVRSLWRR